MDNNPLLLLSIQRMDFLSTNEKNQLVKRCCSIELLPEKDELEDLIGRLIPRSYKREHFIKSGEKDLSQMLKLGINFVYCKESSYPSLLKEIYNPPFLLYYKGNFDFNNSVNVSIVGPRHTKGRVLREAYELSFNLARSGVSIISGLALGVDCSVHEGALDGLTYTAAVFGSGLDSVYPLANKKLAHSILDSGGVLLSEYPPGTMAKALNFPERNRIISALSEAIVIVESPIKSGALITADFALEQNRDLYVLNSPNHDNCGQGTMDLINNGAQTINSAKVLLEKMSYVELKESKKIYLPRNANSEITGQFLAERFLAEVDGIEIAREGNFYSL